MTPAPLFKASYRVLILKNEDAKERHERVLAICLEQNLVGRGANVGESMEDLSATVLEFFKYELRDALVPSAQPDPDPKLLEAYSNPLIKEVDGDLILRRTRMFFECGVYKKSPPTPRRVIYQDEQLIPA